MKGVMFMPKKKTQFGESAKKNVNAYGHYLEQLLQLSVCMFEWKNLPPGIDEVFMERILFQRGSILFYKDEELGQFVALPYVGGAPFDIYEIPYSRRAYSMNGYNWQGDNTNSVIIYNNMIRTDTYTTVERYAEKLWEIDRTIDVNQKAQKTPVLVQGTEKQRLTLLNLYMKYDGNEPFIFGDKNSLDDKPLTSISTGAPYLCDKLMELKSRYWNECLTYIGISNVSIGKKERLITDEVQRNNGGTIAMRHSRLNARKQACEKINAMFGLNIEVDFRDDTEPIDFEVKEMKEVEDVEDE